jgi:hypothetical protein
MTTDDPTAPLRGPGPKPRRGGGGYPGAGPAPNLGRRAFVLGTTTALACSRGERAALGGSSMGTASTNVRLLEWDLGPQPWGQARAAIVVPTWGAPGERFPLLIALHGRGEAVKPPVEGAMGWPRDYAMIRAIDRLRAPPLHESDYEGLVEPQRLAEANASLRARPFGGLVVACPYVPDVASSDSTGIDGVSLGGVIALRVGLTCPEWFGAVGGIQPAIAEGQCAQWTALGQGARARRPDLKIRLLTSSDDYFRAAILGVSRAWNAAGIGHDVADVPGPHDYIFNRGPGSIELLLWHDRALARG